MFSKGKPALLQLKIITDEEIWDQIDALWAQNKLDRDQCIPKKIAVSYIREYCDTYMQDEDVDELYFETVMLEIDTDGNGLIERCQLFNQLKKTIHPEMYEYDMQLKAIDEMNGKTSSASGCIVSEEIDVLE